MKIVCLVAGHSSDRNEAYNGGFHFSRCSRCRCDMIRSSGDWEAVPEGHRVAWKSGRQSHSIDPDFSRVLPILHPQANLPALRPSFMSWSRQLSRMRAARRPEPAPSAEEKEAKEKEPYPRLIVLVALIGAGLQLIMGLGGRRRELA
ncbi:MAG TPA: hypothetical protein VIT45_09800 [Allosphingosinicella sp.]